MKTIRIGLSLHLIFLAATTLSFAAPASTRWASFRSNLLAIQISVPADWQPVKMSKALAFKYDDLAGGSAAIGILKSDRNLTIEQAAAQEFNREGRPTHWLRSWATVAGMRAIKMVGTSDRNPGRKMVHYYVETPQGVYLIQCQASQDRWHTFSPIFADILTKLKFLNS